MTNTAERFTAEEALKAHEDGAPIMLTSQAAMAICQNHGQTLSAFIAETSARWPASYDAWAVLEWLGY